MNFMSSGLISLLVLYLSEPFIQYVDGRSNLLLILPIYTYFALQWGYDVWVGYEAYTFRLANHFDMMNIGYTLGKFSNASLNFISFYLIMSALKVQPPQAWMV